MGEVFGANFEAIWYIWGHLESIWGPFGCPIVIFGLFLGQHHLFLQPKRAFMAFYQNQWMNNSMGGPKYALDPFCLQKGVEFVCKMGWNCPNNGKNLAIGPQKIIPELPPKGPPTTMYLRPVQLYITWGCFWPFWTRKRAQISPKMASIACNLTSKLTQICPKWTQNDSQTTPTVLYSCGQYYCTLFGGIHVIFGWRKGRNQPKTLDLMNLHGIVF